MIKYNDNTINGVEYSGSNITKVYYNDKVCYEYVLTPSHDYSQDYLTLTFKNYGNFVFSGGTVNYSTNSGKTWNKLTSNTPSYAVHGKVLLKGTLSPSANGVGRFSASTSFDVEGNSMSLLYGDDFVGQTSLYGANYTFVGLFSGCTGLTSAENLVLPATTLSNYCYQNMFNGCIGLTFTPKLPATTLTSYCYSNMFRNCTSLTAAPQLSATTLATACYRGMFEGCTSLTSVQSVLPATTLAMGCYALMFYNCSNLSTAPELPAAVLPTGCYQSMFYNCSNLNYIKCLAEDITAQYCTGYWVNGVSSTGTFVKAASMNSWTTDESGIPDGWTVQNA